MRLTVERAACSPTPTRDRTSISPGVGTAEPGSRRWMPLNIRTWVCGRTDDPDRSGDTASWSSTGSSARAAVTGTELPCSGMALLDMLLSCRHPAGHLDPDTGRGTDVTNASGSPQKRERSDAP